MHDPPTLDQTPSYGDDAKQDCCWLEELDVLILPLISCLYAVSALKAGLVRALLSETTLSCYGKELCPDCPSCKKGSLHSKAPPEMVVFVLLILEPKELSSGFLNEREGGVR